MFLVTDILTKSDMIVKSTRVSLAAAVLATATAGSASVTFGSESDATDITGPSVNGGEWNVSFAGVLPSGFGSTGGNPELGISWSDSAKGFAALSAIVTALNLASAETVNGSNDIGVAYMLTDPIGSSDVAKASIEGSTVWSTFDFQRPADQVT
jgi:hypothetical protein